MPELPEVETTLRGIAPYITGATVTAVVVREPRLRWPVPERLAKNLRGQTILEIRRRGKYLLLETLKGTAILHLGMSGSLRIIAADTPAAKHDHVDIIFSNRNALRLNDPRRFGTLLWTTRPAEQHKLLRHLGPEPLDDEFSGDYLYRQSRGRRVAVKQFIMNSHIVVGVGNIYASEALFLAGIHPRRAAGRISMSRYATLAGRIRQVLNESLEMGGTTLRDFVNGHGEPGYFKLHLRVYGRRGEPCRTCQRPVREIRLGQRSTCYCPACQK